MTFPLNFSFSISNREARLAVFSILCFLVIGCGKKSREISTDDAIDSSDVYVLEVVKDRKKKDLYLLTNEHSPLKATERERFSGLPYYKPDRAFTFAAVLQRLPSPEEIIMATSKDRPRPMLHVGWFPFSFEGKEYRLQVYMPKDTSDGAYWFIPFTDATNRDETYPGGRYIDIDDTSTDSTFLDFNYAYNPYCAYNERYDCPIPPEENKLPISIEAGEKYVRK